MKVSTLYVAASHYQQLIKVDNVNVNYLTLTLNCWCLSSDEY